MYFKWDEKKNKLYLVSVFLGLDSNRILLPSREKVPEGRMRGRVKF